MAQAIPAVENADSKKAKWLGGQSPFNLSYGKIMMWIFLITDTFTFSAFLISYGAKRFFSNVWPDSNLVFNSAPLMGDANLPMVFVSIMTFILILSSVTMVMAVHAGHYGDRAKVSKWLIWTIIGGILFLSCQAYEWTHLHGHGAWTGSFADPSVITKDHLKHFFNPEVWASMSLAEGIEATNNFFNFFFTITGFHGFHVTIGVVLLVIALINNANGTYERRGHYEMIEKVGLYWHFVDLVWVFVFTSFYLV